MTSELYAALANAQHQAGAVSKDAENTHQRYAYASAEAIITEARAALSANGLCVIPVRAHTVTRDGQLVLTVLYQLSHKAGGSISCEIEWPICPGNGRPVDKATASARTSGLAYFLRDLLLLPRVDPTDDMDSSSRPQETPQAKPARKPPEVSAPEVKPATASLKTLRTLLHGLTDPDSILVEYAGWERGGLTHFSPAQVESVKAYVAARVLLAKNEPITEEQEKTVKRIDQL